MALMSVAEALGPRARGGSAAAVRIGSARRRATAACSTADLAALADAAAAGPSRRWTAMRCARPTSPPCRCGSRSSARSRPGTRFAGAVGAGRRRASSPAACCRRAPTRSSSRRTRHATATCVLVNAGAAQGPARPRRRPRFRRRATCCCERAAGSTERDLAAGCRHEPSRACRFTVVPELRCSATGDELVMPGAEPGPGEIVYSNGFATMALARREGGDGPRSRHRAGPH